MSNLLVYLSVPTVTVGSVAAFWQWGAKKYIDTKINEESQKRLKDHQQKLDAMNMAAEHAHQKRLLDINLYTEKKHEIYREIFQQVYQAEFTLMMFVRVLRISV